VLSALGLAAGSDADCRTTLVELSTPHPRAVVAVAGERAPSPWPDGPATLLTEDGREARVQIADGRLPAVASLGWHRLVRDGESLDLAVCPARALTVQDRLGRDAWGLTAQVYALRDDRPRPFGDFGALSSLVEPAAAEGADALAISPVHALFGADPERYSPYSPSSRDFLNPLYTDVGPLEDSGDLIDWPRGSRLKTAALRERFARFDGDPAFDRFVATGGEALRTFALFEALDARMRAEGRPSGFSTWPATLRSPETLEVRDFAAQAETEIRFHLFAQWSADQDLAAVQAGARRAGMGLGLISDLAVGVDPYGAHAWSRPDELLTGLTLGAPPDAFQPAGQSWGITSFSPVALRRLGYAPYLRTLRTALRHAGGVRIDHALGLNRLWVVPDGASSSAGAYLSNPLEPLLRLTALESVRRQAVIIGEDLGVVPPDLRARLDERGILGMRVLPFERDGDGGFTAPRTWDRAAAAMTSTHDLPPIAGWWTGRDIDWRGRLEPDVDRQAETAARESDRALFWKSVVASGAGEGSPPPVEAPARAVDAAIDQTAQSACELALIPIEDLLGLDEQPNIPGVVDGHPNWRRRTPKPSSELFDDPAVAARAARLRKARPR